MNISFLFVTLVASMIPYLAIRNLLRPGIVFDSISLEKLVTHWNPNPENVTYF